MFPPTSVPRRGVRLGVHEHCQPTLALLLKSPSTANLRPPKAWAHSKSKREKEKDAK